MIAHGGQAFVCVANRRMASGAFPIHIHRMLESVANITPHLSGRRMHRACGFMGPFLDFLVHFSGGRDVMTEGVSVTPPPPPFASPPPTLPLLGPKSTGNTKCWDGGGKVSGAGGSFMPIFQTHPPPGVGRGVWKRSSRDKTDSKPKSC